MQKVYCRLHLCSAYDLSIPLNSVSCENAPAMQDEKGKEQITIKSNTRDEGNEWPERFPLYTTKAIGT